MAKIEAMETRLLNWARWVLTKGGGVLGFASVNLAKAAMGITREPYAEAPIPTNAIEASETDDAIAKLPSQLRETVVSHYVGRGTLDERLRKLCCAKSTYHERIDRAHRLMSEHFAAREDKRRAERGRVEQLIDAHRP